MSLYPAAMCHVNNGTAEATYAAAAAYHRECENCHTAPQTDETTHKNSTRPSARATTSSHPPLITAVSALHTTAHNG